MLKPGRGNLISQHASSNADGNAEDLGRSLEAVGEYLSEAACCLPNWYSSKEGLTGESPAVFGGGGTALSQAGESWSRSKVEECVSDLLAAACALEPVDLGEPIEEAALAIEKAALSGEDTVKDSPLKYELEAAQAFEHAAGAFEEYGEALEAEEHESNKEKESAGGFLMRAGMELRSGARALRIHGLHGPSGSG